MVKKKSNESKVIVWQNQVTAVFVLMLWASSAYE